MKCLLDTAVFLWTIFDEKKRIQKRVQDLLVDPKNELFLSAASVWEIAIKYSIGKLELKGRPSSWLPEVILKMGLKTLAVNPRHALAVIDLPHHHRDPFDRILVSQAKLEGLTLLTPDSIFRKYQVPVVWS